MGALVKDISLPWRRPSVLTNKPLTPWVSALVNGQSGGSLMRGRVGQEWAVHRVKSLSCGILAVDLPPTCPWHPPPHEVSWVVTPAHYYETANSPQKRGRNGGEKASGGGGSDKEWGVQQKHANPLGRRLGAAGDLERLGQTWNDEKV